jgi:ribosomal protein L30E
MWVKAGRAELAKAIGQNLFSKAAKQKVSAPDNLMELIESLLVKRTIDLLSMARKSGHAICGYEKTKSAMISERWYLLIQAEDGSDGQKRKIRPSSVANCYISCLTAQELGLAFGRENVIHAAVSKGGLSARILLEANRLAGFRENYDATPSNIAGSKPAAKG